MKMRMNSRYSVKTSPIVFRVERRSLVDVKKWCLAHIDRDGNLASAAHIDASKSHLNRQIAGVTSEEIIAKLSNAILKPDKKLSEAENAGRYGFARTNKKLAPELVKQAATEIIMTADGDWLRERQAADPSFYEAFQARALDFIRKKHGDEAVLGVWSHLDEQTFHIHGLVMPLAKIERKGSVKTVLSHYSHYQDLYSDMNQWRREGTTDINSKLGKIQTEVADFFSDLGLERGQRNRLGKGKPPKHDIDQGMEADPADFPNMTPPREFTEADLEPSKSWASHCKNSLGVYTTDLVARGIAEAFCRGANQNRQVNKPQFDKYRSAAMKSIGLEKKLDQATEKIAELQKGVKYMTEEVKRIQRWSQEQIAAFRDLPLDVVAEALGMGYVVREQAWRTTANEKVSIDKASGKFKGWNADIKGGKAIDLVMAVGRMTFTEACAWLRDRFGTAAASAAFCAKVREEAEETVKKAVAKPFVPPSVDERPESMQRIKAYLRGRGLDMESVEVMIKSGNIFPTSPAGYPDLVNVGFRIDGTEAVELVGVNGKFKGFAPTSNRDSGPAFWITTDAGPGDIVVTESAVKAIAYGQLHPDRPLEIVSSGGCRPSIPWLAEEAKKGKKVIVAYDNDKAGNENADKLIAWLRSEGIDAVRHSPPEPVAGHKVDWDDLLPKPVGIDVDERDEETLEQQNERFRRYEQERLAAAKAEEEKTRETAADGLVEALEKENQDNDWDIVQSQIKLNIAKAQRSIDREDKDEGNRPGY